MNNQSVFRSLRVVAGFSLLGTVMAGTLFGGLGVVGIHEVGAVFGFGLGIAATAKHFV